MTSRLQIKPRPGGHIDVTPESAGWQYVGFAVETLPQGESISRYAGKREVCLVLISGFAQIDADHQHFGELGGRMSPFDGPPAAVYVPAGSWFSIEATTELVIATCSAPGGGDHRARVIDVPPQIDRGAGTNMRFVTNILPETDPGANALLVVEVITPAGNASSYPPHKHDQDNLPHESQLEETYYHRLNPSQGFAFQRVYTDDRSLDESIAVEDGDVVLVPRGYHPCAAVHGYDLYYLNVMAGPKRIWKFHNATEHEWMLKG